jgi:hypothetical protein
MAVVAVAIMVSFHLKRQPTAIELKVAAPLGLIFWLLALACLASGLHNYIKTVNHYSTRQAIVQSGLGTQLVRPLSATPPFTGADSLTGFHCHCLCNCGCLYIVPIDRVRKMKPSDRHEVHIFSHAMLPSEHR